MLRAGFLRRITRNGVSLVLNEKRRRNDEFGSFLPPLVLLGMASVSIAYSEELPPSPGSSKGLPTYRIAEVSKHTTKEAGIWVIYKDGSRLCAWSYYFSRHIGVYDITKFIANHPGGSDKIVLAAGKSVEPFWSIYRYSAA